MMRILAAWWFAMFMLSAAELPWTPAHYHQQVQQLSRALQTADEVKIVALAKGIAEAQVAWPTGTFPGDPTLLPLAERHAVGMLQQRVSALDRDLAVMNQREKTAVAGAQIDHSALARLSEREAAAGAKLQTGGDVVGNPLDLDNLPLSLGDRIASIGEWIWDHLVALLKWVRDLFIHSDKSGKNSDGAVVSLTLVLVGAVVVIAAVLAFMAWRRREPPMVASESTLVARQTDADPRSRAADEWIRYAQELLALGRHREAIRAWYHAILVGCWSNGLLHHRVGLTNWEYALALSAAHTWRARFLDLTQRFDQAWYGGRVEIDESHAFALEAEQIVAQLRAAKNAKPASAA